MANGSGVVYGQSGSYKSTAAKHFSRYIFETTGKRTLLVSMDGGGWGPMAPEINAGLIIPYRANMKFPLPVLRKISQGYWPTDSGETEIEKTDLRKIDLRAFGGMVVEGLSSISQAIMRHLADNNIKTGEEATSPFSQQVVVNGQVQLETFAGNSRAHYGFVQNQLYALVSNLLGLPLHYILFTALESRTEDDDRSTVYGPQVAGKKATNLVPSWVGDCLHSEAYQVPVLQKVRDPKDPEKLIDAAVLNTKVRTYFKAHPDPVTGITFPAKPRLTPDAVAALEEFFPGGFFEPTPFHGLDTYLHKIDELNSQQTDELADWRKQADERRVERQQAKQQAQADRAAVESTAEEQAKALQQQAAATEQAAAVAATS